MIKVSYLPIIQSIEFHISIGNIAKTTMGNIGIYFTIAIAILLWIMKKLFEEKETLKDLGIPHFKPLPLIGNAFQTIIQRQGFVEFGERLYNEFSKEKYVYPNFEVQAFKIIHNIIFKNLRI